MNAFAGTALGALLLMTAACNNKDPEQQAAAPSFQMPVCSPADPQCRLTEPPRMDERPGPGAE